MSDTSLNKIIQYGTAAARAAFVPAPAAGSQVLYIWYDTDAAPNTYIWNGAAWIQINSTGGGASTTSRFIVSTTEAGLPNSAVLTAGAGIVITGTTGTTTVRNSSTTANFIVTTTEATLPNSRVLVAGSGVTFTTSTTQVIINASGGGGGGGGWTFITTSTIATTTTNLDFTGLGSYKDILVVFRNFTGGSSALTNMVVSTNAGVAWLTASGDYTTLDFTGTETNATFIPLNVSFGSGSARSASIEIDNFGTVYPKVFDSIGIDSANGGKGFIPTTTALNAIRFSRSAGDFTGGVIQIFGKT